MRGFRQTTKRESRLEWWRRQISRQQSTNLSVAEFSRQLGVCVTTFYYWKRRVHQVPQSNPGRTPAKAPSQPATRSLGNAAANFLPVSILDSASTTQLEVELTNACVVRLKGVIDPLLLQAAITAAGQLDGSCEGAD